MILEQQAPPTGSPQISNLSEHTHIPQSSPLSRAKTGLFSKVSLRTLLALSFIGQVSFAVGVTAWFSIQNGRNAVHTIATELRSEVGNRINQRIADFVKTPYQVVQTNENLVRAELLGMNNLTTWEPFLWRQGQSFKTIRSILVANEQREFRSINEGVKGKDKVFRLSGKDTGFKFDAYDITDKGTRGQLLQIGKPYDPRIRPYYKAAVAAKGTAWSVYPHITDPLLTLSVSRPIYNQQGKLLGVTGTTTGLDSIADFLHSLRIGETGQAIILEHSGLLVATSTGEQPFRKQGDKTVAIAGRESANPITQAVAKHLVDTFGGLEQIQKPQQSELLINGKRYYLQILPLESQIGPKWLTVVAIPETDFMNQIQANTRLTILLCIGAAVLASIIAIITSRWIAQPILLISKASQAVASGNLNETLEVKSVKEVEVLAQSFNAMLQQLRESFTALEKSYLEQSYAALEKRSEEIQRDSEVLQADVSHILEVVSTVEQGNLTVQATVSDRATGLVADTLNRLIEELARIMYVVLSTAQKVTQGAEELEQLAASAAGQAQQQTQSVNEVQALIVNFNNLSQETAQQAVVSDEAVQQAQRAVTQGQQEMATMAQELGVLHEGTEQMFKRAQMLTNFVANAAQFAKDQKRVAALTRVLALNASMVAARASEQQDPEQFASVAREFETIATQVNDLAVETNQSLLLLQQRTDQIQTVVSGINQDVQEISNSVNQFTLSVDQSRQVFDNIKTVTDRVAQVGQQVTQSSQAIATTAQSTLRSIQDIATVAAQTERHSRFTSEQAELIDQLSRTLLERVRFFSLSAEPSTREN